MTFRLLPLVAVGAALAVAAPAFAANGITVVSPKSGAKVKAGSRPTFKVKVDGEGTVFLNVCKSKKKDAEGLICETELIQQMKLSGSTASAKAPRYANLTTYFMNKPGTYYWQAYRISCEGDLDDCKQEGAVTKFKVG